MNIYILELKRSLLNKWTLISFSIVSVICGLQCIEVYKSRLESIQILIDQGYDAVINICFETPYSNWIMCYPSIHWAILAYMFPLLAVLPHSMSYYKDYKSGYIKQMLVRVTAKQYTRAKYIATFISGGLVFVLPMILEFMVLATFLPLHDPHRFNGMLNGETVFGMQLFYEHPFVFTLMWWGIEFVFAGLFACIALMVSKYISNYFSVFITPFTIAFIMYTVSNILQIQNISIFSLMYANTGYTVDFSILPIYILVFAGITYFGFVSSRKEVY